MTNLFKDSVYMTVTTTNIDNHKGYRLFLSTIAYENLYAIFSQNEQLSDSHSMSLAWLTPLYFYSLRWNIKRTKFVM